jgi:biopolymer transport protein TolR
MRQRRQMNEINVVPYIDVMLVLLVIFMVTAPMVQTGSVNLPSVGKSSAPPVAPLEVIIHADQSVSLKDRSKTNGGDDEVRLERGELAAKLRVAQQRNPDQGVLIAADKSVRYEAVLNVMDELQKQQIAKIGLLVHQGK